MAKSNGNTIATARQAEPRTMPLSDHHDHVAAPATSREGRRSPSRCVGKLLGQLLGGGPHCPPPEPSSRTQGQPRLAG
jgi:hypothetical protein